MANLQIQQYGWLENNLKIVIDWENDQTDKPGFSIAMSASQLEIPPKKIRSVGHPIHSPLFSTGFGA